MTPQSELPPPAPLTPTAWARPTDHGLRRVLVASDVAAVAGAWALVLRAVPVGGGRGHLVPVVAVTVLALALLVGHQLYLARVCRVRVVEVSRLLRVSFLTGLAAHVAGPSVGIDLAARQSASGAVAMAMALWLSRGVYASWLRHGRAQGRHTRPVVILGSNDEGRALERLMGGHPELGFEPVAILGSSADPMSTLMHHRSDSVVIATSAFGTSELNRVTRRLLDSGVHVHLSSGLSGIDHRRLRAQPLAREPLFYVERVVVSPWQLVAKRAVDVVGSVVGLALALPVLALAALAIKLEDRGPVVYRHERIGKGGRPFIVHKLRTMVPDADRQLHIVLTGNQRSGPLFKSHNDPRVTRVGRWLRASSVDELPQLFNVLRGSMSLVGPRPALAHEVEQFDDDLRDRHRVRPGITGLWQIEGRDDPSFDAYRRLDLFYVENWSLELDFVILLSTARAVLVQAIRDVRRKWKPGDHSLNPLPVIDLSVAALTVSPASIDLTRPATEAAQ